MNQFEIYFENSPDLLCVAGTDGYFKQLNRAFEQTLGWTRAELLANSFLDFVHIDDLPITVAELERWNKGELSINFQNRYQCKDGSYQPLSWNTQIGTDGLIYGTARVVSTPTLFLPSDDINKKQTIKQNRTSLTNSAISTTERSKYHYQAENKTADTGQNRTLNQPLAIHNQQVGSLTLTDPQNIPNEAAQVMAAVSERLSTHIERLNLIGETEQALEKTEALYQGIDRVLRAATTSEILQALLDSTSLKKLDRVAILFFNRAWKGERPESMNIVASWKRINNQISGPQETIYALENYTIVDSYSPDSVTIFENLIDDPRLDDGSRQLLVEQLLMSSMMVFPLVYRGRWIGMIHAQSQTTLNLSEAEIRHISSLTDQAAIVVQNQRLFELTQTALAETEALYVASDRIIRAQTMAEVLLAVVESTMLKQLDRTNIMLYDRPWDDIPPKTARLVMMWEQETQNIFSPSETVYPIEMFPYLHQTTRNTPLVLKDITTIENLDEQLVTLLTEKLGMRGVIVFPLIAGGQWFGHITGQSRTALTINEAEIRQIVSLTDQAATVIQNQRLFGEAQERADQLEIIAQVELALSQATTEQEILKALLPVVMLSSVTVDVALGYIETDDQNQPDTISFVAVLQDGLPILDPSLLHQTYQVSEIPLTSLWLAKPDELLVIADVMSDPRTKTELEQSKQLWGFRSIVYLPLYSGGRWQGGVNFTSPDPHAFSDQQLFIFRRLLESIGAIVTSRRSYLRAEAARQETERLYQASRHINEANTLSELLTAIAEGGAISAFNRMLLIQHKINARNRLTSFEVTATWYSGLGTPPAPNHTQYSANSFMADILLQPTPMFCHNIWHDDRILLQTSEILFDLNIQTMAVLPLFAGNHQRGAVLLLGDEPYRFTESEKQPYIALARQLAVALENQRLLQETQHALAEVEAVQRRYTLQSWGYYRQHQTKLQHQQTRDDVAAPKKSLSLTQILPQLANVPYTTLNPPEQDESTLLIPLKVRDESIGVLGLQEKSAQHQWTLEEVALVSSIAEQAAQAAENLRLLDQTQQRAAREVSVNDIGEAIRATKTVETAVQVALKQLGQTLEAPLTIVTILRERWPVSLGTIDDQAPLILGYNLIDFIPNPSISTNSRETITKPLMLQSQHLGELQIKKPPHRFWSQDEMLLIEEVAQQLAQKVENLRLFEETQQQAYREQVTRHIADKIRSSQDMEQALQVATEELTKALGINRTTIHLQVAD